MNSLRILRSRIAEFHSAAGPHLNPQGLGMSRLLSEDPVRRAFQGEAAPPLERWQREHLLRGVAPMLKEPWICDIDVTIKTVYGRQQGAETADSSCFGKGVAQPLCAAETPTLFREPAFRGRFVPFAAPDIALGPMSPLAEA